jgi:hypothetical protein
MAAKRPDPHMHRWQKYGQPVAAKARSARVANVSRWLPWVERIRAAHTWTMARIARYGSRIDPRHNLAMSLARPWSIAGQSRPRTARSDQPGWRFHAQVRLSVQLRLSRSVIQVVRVEPRSVYLANRAHLQGASASAGVALHLADAWQGGTGAAGLSTNLTSGPGTARAREAQHSTRPQIPQMAAPVRMVMASARLQPMGPSAEEEQNIRMGRGNVAYEPVPLATGQSLLLTHRIAQAVARREVAMPAARVQTARPVRVDAKGKSQSGSSAQMEAFDGATFEARQLRVDRRQKGMHMEDTLIDLNRLINVEQLADRVMQSLDRRFLAHRERTGTLY